MFRRSQNQGRRHRVLAVTSQAVRVALNFRKRSKQSPLQWLLCRLFATGRQSRLSTAGFVLPTAIFLVIVMTLVVGALVFRSHQRTSQAIGERQGQVIYNAAAPAIDRAKVKLEYLFSGKDSRLPTGEPTENLLAGMLLNNGQGGAATLDRNPYDLPDEIRLTEIDLNVDFNQDGTISSAQPVPAWKFPKTTRGSEPVTVYSIVLKTQVDLNSNGNLNEPGDVTINSSDLDKANALVVRNGPTAVQGGLCQAASGSLSQGRTGWFKAGNNGYSRKSFQVYALSLPQALADGDATNNPLNPAIAALQYQQDREIESGNTWGAWFRSDLEISPGPEFSWNGRMHTEGSLFATALAKFRSYLISAPNSCYYLPEDNSKISARGLFATGSIRDNNFSPGNTIAFDIHPGSVAAPTASGDAEIGVSSAQDSVNETGMKPIDLALDPLKLITEDKSQPRGIADYRTVQDANWKPDSSDTHIQKLVKRIKILGESSPLCQIYVDDTYRADNRYGPKPSYGKATQDPATGACTAALHGQPLGSDIPAGAATDDLTRDEPSANGGSEDLGLDGYWERRARRDGLRLIVGQRLELSNPLATFIPKAVSNPANRENEARQRRALQDNLAAVQATAIYHYGSEQGYLPTTCLATTVHPGTAVTLNQASTFADSSASDINFFTGHGTNGWEFAPPPESSFSNPSSDLLQALRNLAYFAGDPEGAFPPKQAAAGTQIHPDPLLTHWGNFSELRRVVSKLDGGTNYADLSIADQSTLHTAGCLVGMLANNVNALEIYAGLDPKVLLLQTAVKTSRSGAGPYLPLYYLFPTSNHYELRSNALNPLNPTSPYVGTVNGTATTGVIYQAVAPSSVAISPREIGSGLPKVSLAGATSTSSNRYNLINVGGLVNANGTVSGGTFYRIPFKDTALLNGREMINVRAFTLDLDLLRRHAQGSGNTWLPNSGLVYAFREDAVREDALARPKLKTWSSYLSDWLASKGDPTDLASILNVNQGQDPPVCSPTAAGCQEGERGISPKPVDYYADPERRPHGFRLRNGTRLDREGIAAQNNIYGLSLISDNPVYVQGDFNLHSTDGTTGSLLEEFSQPIDYGNLSATFYSRTTPQSEFARSAASGGDTWRPTEVLADAVTILSSNFCDGSVEDSFLQDGSLDGGNSNFARSNGLNSKNSERRIRYGCEDDGTTVHNTSYLNQNLLSIPTSGGSPTWLSANTEVTKPAALTWVRENDLTNSPVRVSAQGNPVVDTRTWFAPAEIQPASAGGASPTCGASQRLGVLLPNYIQRFSALPYNSGSSPSVSSDLNLSAYVQGLCFQSATADGIKIGGKTVRVEIDSAGQIILDEVSRRPIPVPNYQQFSSDKKNQRNATPVTRVNAILISGIVPSRTNQASGGLHNFPRFLETWSSLYLSGSLIQLNYSNYATAPFDQDAWEPPLQPSTSENNYYYDAPDRYWGYDVGLQYAAASPVAKRIATLTKTRDEFYRELPAVDPYICKLRATIHYPCN